MSGKTTRRLRELERREAAVAEAEFALTAKLRERAHEGFDVPWTPFQSAEVPLGEFHGCWVNSRYQVFVRYLWHKDAPMGAQPILCHLSIKAHDKEWIHDWRDLQRLKNEICGTLCEAVELYPREDRLTDEANQYHLWVLPPGQLYPVGYFGRHVDGPAGAAAEGARQRVFDLHHNAKGCTETGVLDWPGWSP